MSMSLSITSEIDPADFLRFDPVPREGIERAVSLMQSGKLFRYSNSRLQDSEVALLERDFAEYVGMRYALGVSSCSAAIELALIACDVGAGTGVLVPGFTFTAVPSAIVALRAKPVFVECNNDYRIDIDDLRRKVSPDTKVLLLSHMRGYAPDMDAVMSICDEHNIVLIEDAAHALGGRWRGKQIGSFGKLGCFSFQSNKIINAGEGGVLVTDSEELIVKAICLSGAYEANYQKHFIQSPLFEQFLGALPAHNARMTNVTAAIARPQVRLVEKKGARYREMNAFLRRELETTECVQFPEENPNETRVPDSIQFRLQGFDASQMRTFIRLAREKGLPIAGFAERNNARAFYNWHYLGCDMPDLPQTKRAIANACDIRLPSTLTDRHLSLLASIVRTVIDEVRVLELCEDGS